ncbi:hypothetical protein CTZ24_14445 [Pantoea phytobeneficialis]|uniref:Uncharacterized protein n=1 Tax=Pantoea phytobeneficialis TaxID=2052056 RepID=A0AAP9H6C6_9GAMM|nr:hypothetical protein CTZ24_14445 [Pantoea phytobeneficialis]
MQALSQLSYSPEPKKPPSHLDGRHNMKPLPGCQRQISVLCSIAEKGGKPVSLWLFFQHHRPFSDAAWLNHR